jgi:hypothetical protein
MDTGLGTVLHSSGYDYTTATITLLVVWVAAQRLGGAAAPLLCPLRAEAAQAGALAELAAKEALERELAAKEALERGGWWHLPAVLLLTVATR